MSSTFSIDMIEAALIDFLCSKLPLAYGAFVDVNSLGDDDFDEEGTLVLRPPSARLRFMDATYKNLRDNQRLTYQTDPHFELWCYESSLRNKADQRRQTLVLGKAAQGILAGTRLQLADQTQTMPISLLRVGLVNTASGPVDQLFAVEFIVEGIAQFNGEYAQPGQ